MCSVCMPSDQIEKREQEDPDDVDEVPVQPADLDGVVVLVRDRSAPCPPRHHAHDSEADDHVQGVESRHHEVERKEDLGMTEMLRLEGEPEAGHVMLDELAVVLIRLDAEKHGAEKHGRRQKPE